MPFPNYHVARVREPKDFKDDSIRTIHGGTHVFAGSGMIVVPENIMVITGQLLEQHYEGSKIERAPQSLRFPVSDFTEAEAKRWIKDERVKILMFEPATESVEKVEKETDDKNLAPVYYNYITNDDSHEIQILGDIGEGSYSAELITNDIIKNQPENLVMNISSLGGNVNDALQVYDFLRNWKGQVTAKISGMTASAATIIAMGADKIEMSPHSLMLIHSVWSPFVSGNADDLEKSAQDMRKIDSILVDIYKKKTNKRKDSIEKLMQEERWLNLDEALKFGLVDKKGAYQKNTINEALMNSLKERGYPSLPTVFLNTIKTSEMEFKELTDKVEKLASKIEGIFTPKKDKEQAETISKEEVLAKVDAEITELKSLYEAKLTELNDSITAKDEELVSIKNTHETETDKLSDEVSRLTGGETQVIKTDEVELEKAEAEASPFDAYADRLRNSY